MRTEKPLVGLRCDVCGTPGNGLPLTEEQRAEARFARWITAVCVPCRKRQQVKRKPAAKQAAA